MGQFILFFVAVWAIYDNHGGVAIACFFAWMFWDD